MQTYIQQDGTTISFQFNPTWVLVTTLSKSYTLPPDQAQAMISNGLATGWSLKS